MIKQIATCGSPNCTGIPNHLLNKKHFVIIDEAKGRMCPRCGYALRWVDKVNEKYKTVTRKSVDKKIPKDYGLNQSV